MKKLSGALILIAALGLSLLFRSIEYGPGLVWGSYFLAYLKDMLRILPFAFILIGLFEVWVKRETVERHLGTRSSPAAFLWAILLGGVTVGPMLVALPVAQALRAKGARLPVVLTYLGAAAVCRIPMMLFESSYLGLRFTILRFGISLPLILLSSLALGRYLEGKEKP